MTLPLKLQTKIANITLSVLSLIAPKVSIIHKARLDLTRLKAKSCFISPDFNSDSNNVGKSFIVRFQGEHLILSEQEFYDFAPDQIAKIGLPTTEIK